VRDQRIRKTEELERATEILQNLLTHDGSMDPESLLPLFNRVITDDMMEKS
jgi:hypothetical protein